ncbi:MAG TPA: hypothetical protein PK573_02410 [Spirochaetota bacterium]|nr:hypothetical protein [Spirochaetota bacterium]HRZ25939.1 hypothetical protein [Spirochaetota bacterium]HSA15303.1 hypothetical protein [Spirochaetota bacterium]
MINRKATRIAAIAVICCLTAPAAVLAQRTKSSLSAGEQRYAEKGLKDNRYFFYFINSSISNFGTEEEKTLFREAIRRDMIAQILYLKFLFHESFVEIKRSQKILIDLYRTVLKRDIGMTKDLLDDFARGSIKSGKYRSKHYLKLGYRDVTEARIFFKMADHYRATLYSMRLYEYVKAIKDAKHGKRYAFYSKLESVSPDDIKREWGHFPFDDLEKKITGLSEEKKDYYAAIHYDNYYRARTGKSYYDMIWENPQLEEIPEYQDYLGLR